MEAAFQYFFISLRKIMKKFENESKTVKERWNKAF